MFKISDVNTTGLTLTKIMMMFLLAVNHDISRQMNNLRAFYRKHFTTETIISAEDTETKKVELFTVHRAQLQQLHELREALKCRAGWDRRSKLYPAAIINKKPTQLSDFVSTFYTFSLACCNPQFPLQCLNISFHIAVKCMPVVTLHIYSTHTRFCTICVTTWNNVKMKERDWTLSANAPVSLADFNDPLSKCLIN